MLETLAATATAAATGSEHDEVGEEGAGGGREELAALRAEVAQYEEEFALLKNQEVSIRRLEEEIASLQDMHEDAIAQVAERRTAEMLQEMQEQQHASEKHVAGLLDALKASQVQGEHATQQVRMIGR